MSRLDKDRPDFNLKNALKIAEDLYGISGIIKEIPSERDRNFYLKTQDGLEYVLKIAATSEKKEILEFQNQAMEYLMGKINCPRVLSTKSGHEIATVSDEDNRSHYVRLLTYLPGKILGDISDTTADLLYDLGRFIGDLTIGLDSFHHPATKREFHWDLKNASSVINQNLQYQDNLERKELIKYYLNLYESIHPYLQKLKMSVIHSDANDYNLVVDNNRLGKDRFAIIDFGDMVYSYTIFELVIAIAYAILEKEDPLYCASHIIRGYNSIVPLSNSDLDVLFILICTRLVVSVSISAHQKNLEPDNEYLRISEAPAWRMLFKLRKISPSYPTYIFKTYCNISPFESSSLDHPLNLHQIMEKREKFIGKNLSISYKKPLYIKRGFMQYLYDENDRTYLDMRNNVPHVGHSHPKVTWSLYQQAAILNTNTRYFYQNLVQYAERLCGKLPKKLNVCYFVNSGSEANELALRLARTYTDQQDVITIEGAYHGNTGELINVSSYKFNGIGGRGAPDYVHTVRTPDTFRGEYKAEDPQAGKKYAQDVSDVIKKLQRKGRKPAVFIFESLMGSAGQIIYPKDYLKEVFNYVHASGGLCLSDEVQVGFGRLGTHFWGFEIYDVVPDIVTMGKPIGNGHPIGAVVTTIEIANSFSNGMEFFSTTGGNTVSCAVGIEVLNILEEEKLQRNALIVGNYLFERLEELKEKYTIIGDIRGSGLFLGIDLIKERETLTPAIEEAANIVERMKDHGILIGNDKNVLKLKPPMVFTKENAEFFIRTFEEILKTLNE